MALLRLNYKGTDIYWAESSKQRISWLNAIGDELAQTDHEAPSSAKGIQQLEDAHKAEEAREVNKRAKIDTSLPLVTNEAWFSIYLGTMELWSCFYLNQSSYTEFVDLADMASRCQRPAIFPQIFR